MSAVDLVSITTPLVGIDMSAEQFIVYVARVSNPSNQMNIGTTEQLLRYLITHKHWSPFEFVDMTVQITTRRSIAAQMLRHRSFSFQEFSQRYAESTAIQPIELRKQAEKNRQSSEHTTDPAIYVDGEGGHVMPASTFVDEHMQRSRRLYDALLEAGVAREVARDVLPLATETTLYMKGSVRSWIHYLQLRTAADTQKEHRLIADDCSDLCGQLPNDSFYHQHLNNNDMIKTSVLSITDYGPYWAKVPLDYVNHTYATARYSIVSNGSTSMMWTNDPKVVQAYATQFAQNITQQQQQP